MADMILASGGSRRVPRPARGPSRRDARWGMLRRVGEAESGPPERRTPDGRATAFTLVALLWVVAVSALYVGVRVFGLSLVR